MGGEVFRHQMEDELRPTERPHSAPPRFSPLCAGKRDVCLIGGGGLFFSFSLSTSSQTGLSASLPPSLTRSLFTGEAEAEAEAEAEEANCTASAATPLSFSPPSLSPPLIVVGGGGRSSLLLLLLALPVFSRGD